MDVGSILVKYLVAISEEEDQQWGGASLYIQVCHS
jgi:hypothetical protein